MFRPPRLLVPQVVPTAANVPQGSRDFYIRAERASLPRHAPDMLAVRIQAIDGARTSTLQDSQPCRLLPLHLLRTPDILCANDSGQLVSYQSANTAGSRAWNEREPEPALCRIDLLGKPSGANPGGRPQRHPDKASIINVPWRARRYSACDCSRFCSCQIL